MNTIELVKTDFYRFYGNMLPLWKILALTIKDQAKGQGWMLFFRMANSRNFFVSSVGKIFKKHYSHKYCIDIPTCTQIGKGCYIGHGICMVIHGQTIIGNNVSLSQFLNIGTMENKAPVIGNNVYIGPNVSIVGNIHIGNNVTIGAGAVVVNDIPDNATVVGVPAKVINFDNPEKYIYNPT